MRGPEGSACASACSGGRCEENLALRFSRCTTRVRCLWSPAKKPEQWKSIMSNPPRFERVGRAFRPVRPEAKYLWHVMDRRGEALKKLKTFLEGGLWFARLDQFNEELEGTLPLLNKLGLFRKLPRLQVGGVLDEYTLGIQRGFAQCWHMSRDAPSEHAWAEFSNTSNGVAVRTTVEALEEALSGIAQPGGPGYIGEVRYIDHWTDFIPEANVIEAAFVVRSGFRAEREARCFIHTKGTAASDHLLYKEGRYGPLVKVVPPGNSPSGKHEFTGGHHGGRAIVVRADPRKLIQAVAINPRVSKADRGPIEAVLKESGFEDRLLK